jgi:hypothetical protein
MLEHSPGVDRLGSDGGARLVGASCSRSNVSFEDARDRRMTFSDLNRLFCKSNALSVKFVDLALPAVGGLAPVRTRTM